MTLPKTYWNDLSEEAQIAFFDMWMEEGFVCRRCPEDHPVYNFYDFNRHSFCAYLCNVLFRIKFNNYYEYHQCPCHIYGEDAVRALEKAMIDAGWIDGEDE